MKKETHKNTLRPTSITIQNFKGFGEPVTIPLKPITLLFGKNSAGKSTILQALLYLGEVLKTKNGDVDEISLAGKSIKLGGFENIVHGQDPSKIISIKINFDAGAINWDKLSNIDEFTINFKPEHGKKEIYIDVSDVGEILENGTIEFKIGNLRRNISEFKYGLISTDIYFNDAIFARIGKITSRDDLNLLGNEERIVLNEIHPLFGINGAIPTSYDKNLINFCRQAFQSPLLDAYLLAELINSKPDLFINSNDELIKDFIANQEKETADKFVQNFSEAINDISIFKENSLRLYYDEQCEAIIEIGQSSITKELEIYQFIKPKNLKPTFDIKLKYTTTQYYPILNNLNRGLNIKAEIELPTMKESPESAGDEGNEEKDKFKTKLNKKNCQVFFKEFLNRFCFGTLGLVKDFIDQNRYIGPIREIPSRNHATPFNHKISRWGSGLAAWDLMLGSPKADFIIQETNNHLKNTLQISYALEISTSIDIQNKEKKFREIIDKIIKAPESNQSDLVDLKAIIENTTSKRSLKIRDLKKNVQLSLNPSCKHSVNPSGFFGSF